MWVTCWGGSWWAPEWQVLLGEGFLVGRALSSWKGFFRHGGGFLRASGVQGLRRWVTCWGGLGGLPNGRYCWVKGFWLPGDHLDGRVSFAMVAGFCGLLECRVCVGGRRAAGGVLVGSRMVGFAGWRGFARGSSSWKAFFRHGGGFLRAAGVQGLLRWVTCWGGVLVGSRMAGIAGWRVSSWQGIIFMDGFLSTRGRVSLWQGLFDTGFLVCMGWAGACE